MEESVSWLSRVRLVDDVFQVLRAASTLATTGLANRKDRGGARNQPYADARGVPHA